MGLILLVLLYKFFYSGPGAAFLSCGQAPLSVPTAHPRLHRETPGAFIHAVCRRVIGRFCCGEIYSVRVLTPRYVLFGAMLASAGALTTALIAQYGFGFEPCVLCSYQRIPYAVVLVFGLCAFCLLYTSPSPRDRG